MADDGLRPRPAVRDLPEPGRGGGGADAGAGPAGRGERARPGLGAGPPLPGQAPGHLDAAVGDRGADHARSGSLPTWPTCRCGRPVVLARAAATLDLLSGGRVELGLGAGAFWDAIVAAGGPRRTPREAVDALVEAIGIIRAVWGGGTVRAVGEHYQVNGLHAGPQPAHDIPIWIGAYKPRMLRRHRRPGRRLDPVDGVRRPARSSSELNAAIDERRRGQRARSAGDPADVQRLRPLRHRRRLPPGHGARLGRAARRARDRRGHQHVRPRHRRPRRRTPVRPRGGAGGARAGRGRAGPARRRSATPAVEERAAGGRGARAGGRATTRHSPSPPPPTPAPASTGELPWDESTRPTLPGAGGRGVHRGAAGLPPAPRRHPRRPARRARPAARRGRPGAARADAGRARPGR